MAELVISHKETSLPTVSCLSNGAKHFEFYHVTLIQMCSMLLIVTNLTFPVLKLTAKLLSNDKRFSVKANTLSLLFKVKYNRKSLFCSFLGGKFCSKDLQILKDYL